MTNTADRIVFSNCRAEGLVNIGEAGWSKVLRCIFHSMAARYRYAWRPMSVEDAVALRHIAPPA